jgi:dienelactone hydrolase
MRLLLAALSFAAVAVPAPRSVGRDVTIPAPDGAALRATYAPAATGGPAVLLLHSCNSDRRSWNPVLEPLAATGVHVLSLDYRGFGESAGPAFATSPPRDRRALVYRWPADIDAALQWLAAQPGVDATRLGVGGSSCGVTQAVLAASRHQGIRSLVLLAGPPDTAARRYLLKATWLPVLTSAAADDTLDEDPVESMQWVSELSGNPRNRFVPYADGGHGTEILRPHPDLGEHIVRWFRETLTAGPAAPGQPVTPVPTPARDFWVRLDRQNDVSGAAEVFRAARARDPDAFLFPEPVLNQAAYLRLQDGDVAGAVTLFRLNTEAYPSSANAWDSLGDGYLANHQEADALQAARRCVALLDAGRLDEETRRAIRASAEGKIAKLSVK